MAAVNSTAETAAAMAAAADRPVAVTAGLTVMPEPSCAATVATVEAAIDDAAA